MIFQDKSFGGELVTVGDSMLVFDATECLAAFLISEKIPLSSVKKVCSVNYGRPTMLADANTAWYLRSDKILSPMEAGLAAFASKQTADSVRVKLGGEVLTWKEVLNVIRARWFRKPQLK